MVGGINQDAVRHEHPLVRGGLKFVSLGGDLNAQIFPEIGGRQEIPLNERSRARLYRVGSLSGWTSPESCRNEEVLRAVAEIPLLAAVEATWALAKWDRGNVW